jgi:hypothetical protein
MRVAQPSPKPTNGVGSCRRREIVVPGVPREAHAVRGAAIFINPLDESMVLFANDPLSKMRRRLAIVPGQSDWYQLRTVFT